MNSTDSFESSSGINLLEDQSSKPTNPRRPRIIVAIFLVFLIIAIIVAIITVYVIGNTHLSPLIANSSNPVQTICAVTRYKRTCYTSLNSIVNNTVALENYWSRFDLDTIALYSVEANSRQLANISFFLKTLISNSTESAPGVCLEMFNNALRLKKPLMSREYMEEVKSWVSMTKICVESCRGRLIDGGWKTSDELMLKMYELREQISNSIAIISNMKMIRNQFYSPIELTNLQFIIIPQYIVLVLLFCLLFRIK